MDQELQFQLQYEERTGTLVHTHNHLYLTISETPMVVEDQDAIIILGGNQNIKSLTMGLEGGGARTRYSIFANLVKSL